MLLSWSYSVLNTYKVVCFNKPRTLICTDACCIIASKKPYYLNKPFERRLPKNVKPYHSIYVQVVCLFCKKM